MPNSFDACNDLYRAGGRKPHFPVSGAPFGAPCPGYGDFSRRILGRGPCFALVYRHSPVYTRSYVDRVVSFLLRYHPETPVAVLTDDPVPFAGAVTVRTRHAAWTGWWSKMELFRPGAFEGAEQIVFLDLDTIVCGRLDDLLERRFGPIAGLSDFYKPGRFASGVMVFRPDACGVLYEAMCKWEADVLRGVHGRGDQDFMDKVLRSAGIEPLLLQDKVCGIISFKVSKMGDNPPPEGTRMVCFHGVPKPHECGGWVKEVWNGKDDGRRCSGAD